jgi:hypothetical protein
MPKKLLLILVVSIMAGAAYASPFIQILTFDDIDTDMVGAIPDGYGGLSWNEFSYIQKDFHPGSGYDLGRVSGDYVAYNSNGVAASLHGVG